MRRVLALAVLVIPLLAYVACNGLVGLDPPQSASSDGSTTDTRGSVDTSCLDTVTDAHNCGSCGHDCLGGTCSGGLCQPVLITTSSQGVASIAVDADNVYWTDPTTGHVLACPLAGCPSGAKTLYSAPGFNWGAGSSVGSIAVQNGQVFFAENQTVFGEVFACPTSGCPSSVSAFAEEPNGPVHSLVADSMGVYWIAGRDVHACPLTGCGGSPAVLVANQAVPSLFGALAVSNGKLFFVSYVGETEVAMCSTTGCGGQPIGLPVPTTGPPTQPYAVAANSSSAFWTIPTNNEVVASPPAPGASGVGAMATVMATPQDPEAIAADMATVYFASSQLGAIFQCPAAGCPGSNAVMLTSGVGRLGELALDAKRIYTVLYPTSGPAQIVWVAR